MTTTPNFDDPTPPAELVEQWSGLPVEAAIYYAYTAGARHGWERTRKTQQMTTTPNFDGLTPPDELLKDLRQGYRSWTTDIRIAYRAGARHGWEQARQLWPEPIRDRRPTGNDSDEEGQVQVLVDGVWRGWDWTKVGDRPWLHTPRWQPRQPSLKEQALKAVEELTDESDGHLQHRLNIIRRALEQAGEGRA